MEFYYLNRLEWLIRTDMRYSGDNFYVCHKEDKKILNISSSRKVLEVICIGGEIHTDDFIISDSNRKAYYELFMAMYQTEKNIWMIDAELV